MTPGLRSSRTVMLRKEGHISNEEGLDRQRDEGRELAEEVRSDPRRHKK